MHNFLKYTNVDDNTTIYMSGEWTFNNIEFIEVEFKRLATKKYDSKKYDICDLSGVTSFDSAGVLLFMKFYKSVSKSNKIKVIGYSQKQLEMYTLLDRVDSTVTLEKKEGFFETIGRDVYGILSEIKNFITFLGYVTYAIYTTFLNPKSIRFKEMIYHIRESGFNALIIIAMTSFLVGMVIAYQGSVQLAKFGADIFIVDTVGISITRELGPMITAIVIAGRSGSAYTAEIGAMKITDEIDAMRTMGFDPYLFLVLPRIFALMISLPLLIFFSDIVGILGGMTASMLQLGISPSMFIDRLYEVLEVKHYILGMIKGPLFAFIIASVGCYRGLQVSHNTESIGLQTTSSVVNSIFLVIAFDAVFSVIYTELGL